MSQTLYVGGIPYSTTEDGLKAYFAEAGTVESAQIIIDHATGRSRGFGFVTMASEEEGQKAVDLFNGKEFEGRNLTVNVARPKTDRPKRTGGFSHGGGFGDRDRAF